MANIDQTEATSLLAALCNGTAYTVPPGWFVALINGTATAPTATTKAAATVEVSGGSYARQAVTFITAAAGATNNNSSGVSFTGMPAVTTIRYIEIYSTVSGTTRRLLYGQLTADKTTASGDILSFPGTTGITMSLG